MNLEKGGKRMIDLEKRAKAWDEFSGEAREFTIGDTFNSAYELGVRDGAASVPRWTKWDWDDNGTWPQKDGFYLCTGGFAGELPACDEWVHEKQEFRHYGIYGYWMPYVPPYTEDTDEQR